MTNPKTFILIILLVIINLSCGKNDLPKPNIIWLISEDNSPFLGCYGDEFATTPNLDRLSEISVKFLNAFANAPVCAPARSTLISGMYATTMGTHHMRSENPTPKFMKFFPYYLKKAGYFTSNRNKKDYNTIDQDSVWDIGDWWSWKDALVGRKTDQPFFIMYNTAMSHESKIHPNSNIWENFKRTMDDYNIDSTLYLKWWNEARHDPQAVKIPPYHPDTEIIKKDWAHYYDCVQLMDREIGVVLEKLKKDSLLENTIIFYFSDHGGVLGRSKRFLFESGLKVPMLLHMPKKYEHLIEFDMGTETDRIVSFIDLAPTMLSLAGLEIPKYFEGTPFVGKFAETEKEYAFGFRGRMDERYDMARTVRNKNFRYIRNYLPQRIYGGRVNYLWKAESMQSWEQEFKKGNLDDVQAAFWNTKPVEELYDIKNDPHNVNNLAFDPNYQFELKKLGEALQNHLIRTKDLGFFPEAEMVRRYSGSTPYDMIRDKNIPFELIVETANIASESKETNLNILMERLEDIEPVVRYWAALGCAIFKEKANKAQKNLEKLLEDISPSVKIAAAEALYHLGEKHNSLKTLAEILSLPKFEKEDSPKNVDLYSNHFAVTQALNVIDALNLDTPELRKIIKTISNSNRGSKRDYDQRIALYLVKKYNL